MSNSLEQYIDVFNSSRTLLEAKSPDVLNRRRPGALGVLEAAGRLPEKGDEGYPEVSVNEMFAPDYGLNIGRVDFGSTAVAPGCDQAVSGRPTVTVVNDTPYVNPVNLPEGVEVMSLSEAAEKYPSSFDEEIAPADNPLVALNDLLVQDGIFIRVKRNVAVGKPVQILSLFNSAHPMMAVRRIFIEVEKGAAASVLLCEHPLAEHVENLSSRVVEVRVGSHASLDVYDIEEASAKSRRASVFASKQMEGSRLNVCSLFLNGGTTRNEFYPSYAGEHCATRLGGLVIGNGRQTVDNSVRLVHNMPRCSSEQLFKYALFEEARCSFEGMVKVNEGAVHTDARQSNRNLLASPDARMYAMPQLEIYCDDVKASHGSATGQLDERALFYMRQRGIPEQEARMMLVNAFMTDVLDTIGDEVLRERLRHLVDLRLRGAEKVCAGCKP